MPFGPTNCPSFQSARSRSGHGGILASQRGGRTGSTGRVLRMPKNAQQLQLFHSLTVLGVAPYLASGIVHNYPAKQVVEALACAMVTGARSNAAYLVRCLFKGWRDLPPLKPIDIECALKLLGLWEEDWIASLWDKENEKEDQA